VKDQDFYIPETVSPSDQLVSIFRKLLKKSHKDSKKSRASSASHAGYASPVI
jgi:hypothetical protein